MSKSINFENIKKEYLDVNHHPLRDEELLQRYSGKDVVIYDERRGNAIRVRAVTVLFLVYYMDEYSTIIVLN